MKRVFVDGASGTVGLALRPHLDALVAQERLELIELPAASRREPDARKDAMRQADLIVLCLPDDAAREAVAMVDQCHPEARILDASAAHRCAPGWAYGLPELTSPDLIRRARRIANPGCFATGAILLGAPISRELGEKAWVPFQGITGYSAGGRKAQAAPDMPRLVQMGQYHRHLPEIQRYANIASPVLTTMVGDWYQGMLVQATLQLPADTILAAYQAAYASHRNIHVHPASPSLRQLSAQCANGTNEVHLRVVEQPYGGATVVAAYDNLGKGSAGAAAVNLSLMLG